MKEFHEVEGYDIAKKILDEGEYRANHKEGWNITEPPLYYSYSNLERILRDDPEGSITDRGEIEIRISFSDLLGFFSKLGYLLDINVISKRELGYFLYYIEKIYNSPAIIKFVIRYNYELFAILLFKLRIDKKEIKEDKEKEDKEIKKLVDRYYERNKHRFFR